MSVESVRQAVLEVERHVHEAGWDQPGRLFALAPTAELLRSEPQLAQSLGADGETAAELTPVEQELEDGGADRLERLLPRIGWPDSVAGVVAVVERVVLPPDAEAGVPLNPDEAASYAAAHPGREDVRIVAGVLRDGSSHCVLRLRSHEHDEELVQGEDLVPALLGALRGTLEGGEPPDASRDGVPGG